MRHQKLLQQMVGITLIAVILAGCITPIVKPISNSSVAVVATPPSISSAVTSPALTPTPAGNAQANYWDGGQYAEQPVFSVERGLSLKAHQELTKCGLNDDVVYRRWDQGNFKTKDGAILISLDGRSDMLLLSEPGIYGVSRVVVNAFVITIMKKEAGKEPLAIGTVKRVFIARGIEELTCNLQQ